MFTADFHSAVSANRWDLYGLVHKGLRLAHAEMLRRLGAADHRVDQSELLAALRAHLAMAAQHLAHEEDFIHPALEAARPGAAAALERDHGDHHGRLAGLLRLIGALEGASVAERPVHGRCLYLAFSVFVAEDMAHMAREETEVWPLLCALFSDAQLADLEMRIVASLTPHDNLAMMRIMLPAMTPSERIGLLGGIKAGAPSEAYAAVIAEAARPTLTPVDFAELQQLGLAA